MFRYFAIPLVLTALCTSHAGAATFTIADGDSAALIGAINTANGNGQSDTIHLAGGSTYAFSTENNTDNALPIIVVDTSANNTLTINGNGATLVRNGANTFRFLATATGAPLIVIDLVFDDGSVVGNGGAIWAQGDLTLTRCTFSNNEATLRGGAVRTTGTATTTVTDSLFQNNRGAGGTGGGAINNQLGALVVNNSRFENNFGLQGGAIYGQAFLLVTNSHFQGNTTPGGGAVVPFWSTLLQRPSATPPLRLTMRVLAMQ